MHSHLPFQTSFLDFEFGLSRHRDSLLGGLKFCSQIMALLATHNN